MQSKRLLNFQTSDINSKISSKFSKPFKNSQKNNRGMARWPQNTNSQKIIFLPQGMQNRGSEKNSNELFVEPSWIHQTFDVFSPVGTHGHQAPIFRSSENILSSRSSISSRIETIKQASQDGYYQKDNSLGSRSHKQLPVSNNQRTQTVSNSDLLYVKNDWLRRSIASRGPK